MTTARHLLERVLSEDAYGLRRMLKTITQDKPRTRTSKDLGWILRHWQRISFEGGFSFLYFPRDMVDGRLIANLRDGTVYSTDFASLAVCFHWLDRPVFRGLPLTVVSSRGTAHWTIGNPAYKRAWRTGNAAGAEAYRRELEIILSGRFPDEPEAPATD